MERKAEPFRRMAPEKLESARALARLLDRSFRVPGTRLRFGLDPILGLLPGGGDVLAALGSGWILYVAWRNGAPARLVFRMLWNVIVDAVVGTVPVLGDLFDAGWHANSRNVRLLERWLERSGPRQPRTKAILVGVGLVLLALVVAAIGVVWLIARAVFGDRV